MVILIGAKIVIIINKNYPLIQLVMLNSCLQQAGVQGDKTFIILSELQIYFLDFSIRFFSR